MGLTTAIVLGATLATSGDTVARPIRYESFKDGKIYYHAVVADMASKQVTAEAYYSERLNSVWRMVGDRQPAAAITGTFFGYESQQPVADVVVDGRLVAQGHRGSAIGVDWYGKVHIFDTPFKKPIDWYTYRHLIRGAVRLIKNGKVSPNPQAQHFNDSRIWGKAQRTGVGLTKEGKVVMMATSNKVTLSQLGNAMKKLGVHDAVALDGGGSAMLYYRGALVVPPTRQLSNLFILHERPLK